MRTATIGQDHQADERRLRAMRRSQDDYWMRKALQALFVVAAGLTVNWLISSM
jgi:hypothetical protein